MLVIYSLTDKTGALWGAALMRTQPLRAQIRRHDFLNERLQLQVFLAHTFRFMNPLWDTKMTYLKFDADSSEILITVI